MADCATSTVNSYAPGNCTFWVKQQIGTALPTFWGNAAEWWNAAGDCGWSRGSAPAKGAIAVWGPGVDPPDGFGHVAVVTGVAGDQFTVSEMNWQGLGKVDTRNVTDKSNLLGFIYPPGVQGGLSGLQLPPIPGLDQLTGGLQGLSDRFLAGAQVGAGGLLILAGLAVVLVILLKGPATEALKVATRAV
jgi:hypothetical protein